MADANSLKAIWDATDKYYIQATTKTKGNPLGNENGGTSPTNRGPGRIMHAKEASDFSSNLKNEELLIDLTEEENTESNHFPTFQNLSTSQNECDSESDSDDAESYLKDGFASNGSGYKSDESQEKFNSKTSGNFDAIPVEFRPNAQGEKLYKIRTLATKKVPERIIHTKEASDFSSNLENEELLIDFTEEKNLESNHFPTFQRNLWNDNTYFGKEMETEEKQSQNEKSSYLASDEVGEREMFRGKFFYKDGLLEKSPIKGTGENVHQPLPEKSSTKNDQIKQTHYGLFYSTSNRSGTTNSNMNSSGDKLKHGKKIQSCALRGSQNKTDKERNKLLFKDNGFQKVTREVTVEKRVNWNNDLCTFKKSFDKPQISYKYTSKVTSDNYFPLEVNKISEKEQRYSETKRHFYNDYQPQNCTNPPFKGKKGQGIVFKENFATKRMQSERFARNDTQNCSRNPRRNHRKKNFKIHNTNYELPVIRHEIKIIHVNDSGNPDEMLDDSYKDKYYENIKMNNQTDPNTGTTRKYSPRNDITKNEKTNTKIMTNEICGKVEDLSLTSKKQDVSVPANKTVSATLSDINSNDNAVLLISHGREISDVIVGSHVAMSTFLAVFNKWKELRGVTLLLFEELEKNLSQTCNKNKKVKEIAGLFNAGVNVVQFVPNPKVATVGKIVAVLSNIVTNVFTSSSKMKDIDLNDFQLRMGLQKDIDAAIEVYMHGLQCDQQFQETRKLIEDFHRDIQNGSYKEFIETYDIEFLKEMSKFNPRNPDVFYRRLEKCFKRLKNEGSDISTAFYRGFEDWPDAVATMSRLHKKFNAECWDSKAVVNAWEEIYDFLQDGNSLVKDVLKKIQNCILELIRERSIFENYATDLQFCN